MALNPKETHELDQHLSFFAEWYDEMSKRLGPELARQVVGEKAAEYYQAKRIERMDQFMDRLERLIDKRVDS